MMDRTDYILWSLVSAVIIFMLVGIHNRECMIENKLDNITSQVSEKVEE